MLDLWIRKIAKELRGRIYLIRYCDDLVIGCTSRKDAHEVWQKLQDRLKKFGLELSCEKSQLIEFGEMAFIKSERDGKKPSTCDFLGFTHYMTRGRKGGSKAGAENDWQAHAKETGGGEQGTQETP